MSIIISETFGATSSPRVVASFDSYDAFAQALGYAYTVLNAQFLQVDKDYPNCADFINTRGQLFKIEPKGFKL